MTLPPDAERYLHTVERNLSAFSAADKDDIVRELRAHLLDRQAQGKTDVLEGFEPPEAFAAGFLQERVLREALVQGGTWRLARSLLIAARDSILLLVAVIPLILLQLTGVLLCCLAVMKVFRPELGLWVGAGNYYCV